MRIEMPEGWEVKQLGTLVTRKPEYGANVSKSEFHPDWPRYVRITDIDHFGNLNGNIVSISPSDAGGYMLHEGDLVIARSGATVGKSYLYNPADGPCAFAGYLIRFQIDSSIADPFFVAQCFHGLPYWQWIASTLRAGAQPNVNAKEYSSFRLPLPPLPEQRKIAATLSSVDEAIQATEAVIEQTRRVKEGLLQELLTKGIGHTRFKQTPIGEIPEEWEAQTVGEILSRGDLEGVQDGNHGEIHPKSADYVYSGVPFVMARNIKDGRIDLQSCSFISEQQAENLRIGFARAGDILLTHKGSIGIVGKVQEGLGLIVLTPQVTYYRVADHGSLRADFLYNYFQSSGFQGRIKQLSKQSTRSYIGISAQKKLIVPIPSLDEQNEFVRILGSVEDSLRDLGDELIATKQLKSGLLQDLLTGKVRVSA